MTRTSNVSTGTPAIHQSPSNGPNSNVKSTPTVVSPAIKSDTPIIKPNTMDDDSTNLLSCLM